MHRPSKTALKAWEKLKKAELASRIANLRSETAAQISSKRRAFKEGKLCSTSSTPAAPKKKRTKRAAPKKRPPAAKRSAAPKRAPKRTAKKKKTGRTKRR